MVGALLLVWLVRGVGNWLVVNEPLAGATAIVPMAGNIPFRAMEAAALYHEGWAPEVWIIADVWEPAREALFEELEIGFVRNHQYNRRALEKLGVPPEAIRLVPGDAKNTADEVVNVADMLDDVGGERVILVTSAYHTRRVRAIWHRLIDQPPFAVVRSARNDIFDGDRWWASTEDAQLVVRELAGLLNVWAGLPLEPK